MPIGPMKRGLRRFAALAERAVYFRQWFLAYKFGDTWAGPSSSLGGMVHLVPPRESKWADPFPVKEGDRYYIFMEELDRKTRRGHISVMELDRSGAVKGPVKILQHEYHLSYPYVFKWRDTYFMVPESRMNRTVELYKCKEFPYEWEHHSTLMSDVGAVDSTLEEIDGRWWMFATIAPDDVSAKRELHLFHSETPLGPWISHPRNPVKSDLSSARPAGRIIRHNGELYRPSQDSTNLEAYSQAVTMNKILHISPSEYEETPVSRISPDWGDKLLATHTFNTCDGLTVVDGLMLRRRLF